MSIAQYLALYCVGISLTLIIFMMLEAKNGKKYPDIPVIVSSLLFPITWISFAALALFYAFLFTVCTILKLCDWILRKL